MYGLAKSQACPDGNKRVALLLTTAFVRLNGARLDVHPGELADMILDVAQSDASQSDAVIDRLKRWIAERLVRLTEEEQQ